VIAARSLAPYLTGPRRYQAMLRQLTMPVLLIHGERDRLMPVRAARKAAKANPGWTFAEAEGVGHVPMLETPEWTAEVVRSFVSS
jgi:pimeloyl-ACP methyl ester carboxylesterase